jgi:glycosyltransferase involved in cell wall biosynthesis
LKILWHSNSPLSQTGYGNQTRLFTPLLKNLGHDIHILAFHGHENYTAPAQWNGITITGRGFHPYGMDVAVPNAQAIKADIVLSLFDAWAVDWKVIKSVRWVPWFPVDHDPIPPEVVERVRYAFARIVYSKFAQGQMAAQDLDCHYVPHGVDTEVFKPVSDEHRLLARKTIGLPEDAFIVGMVAANKGYPSRKAFEQNIAAFKELTKKHKDAFLFLQTWSGEGGPAGRDCVDLVAYCRWIGLELGKNVMFCDQFVNATTGFPDPYMVSMYNSLDVLLSVSRGEGFGIPILEAQACGTPVITGDWTSMSELTFSGWKVRKTEAIPDPTWQKSYQYLPMVGAIAERLEAAYQMRGNREYREKARKGAAAYDMRKVTEKYWRPTLEAIGKRIETVNALRAQIQAPAPQEPTGKIEVKEVTA